MMKIEEICEKAQGLPASPAILPQLLKLLGAEDASLEDLEGIIQTDTSLSAAVLKMANSAYFGSGGSYGDISQAILHLGFSRTHELVITVAGGRWNAVNLAGYSWQPGDFYRHSYAVAVAGSMIAEKVKFELPELVYVAGLMHEAGKLALAFADPECIESIRLYQREHDCYWIEAERSVLGFTHADITTRMLTDWHFPEALIQVARHYPSPNDADPDYQKIASIVHLAKHLAIQTGIGAGEDAFWLKAHEDVLLSVGLAYDDVEEILTKTIKKVRALLQGNMLSGVIKM